MNVNDAKFIFREILTLKKHRSVINDSKWREQYEQFHIIKAMHSIEKGLSLSSPRVGFGVEKVDSLIKRIKKYYDYGYNCNHASIQMSMNAIGEYLSWNKKMNNQLSDLEINFEELKGKISVVDNRGGIISCTKEDILNFDSHVLKKVMETRHSIRDFSDVPVDLNEVIAAVQEANLCPSACNRQPTRVHVVSKEEDKKFLSKRMQGVGGFADKCSAFLLITSNISAYDFTENNQWIVSGGIFIGYLTLALHNRGIAACVIQRSLVRSKQVMELRSRFNIPDNEEIICSLGIGNYKDRFSVPVSARLSVDEIVNLH